MALDILKVLSVNPPPLKVSLWQWWKTYEGKLINFCWPDREIKWGRQNKTNAQWRAVPMLVQCAFTLIIVCSTKPRFQCSLVKDFVTDDRVPSNWPPRHQQMAEGEVDGPQQFSPGYPQQKVLIPKSNLRHLLSSLYLWGGNLNGLS